MRVKNRFIRLLLAFVTLLTVSDIRGRTATAAQGPSSGNAKNNNLYIVQMSDYPVVSYVGGTPGFRATKPTRGQKIDPNSPDVLAYSAYLNNGHSQALAAVGGSRKVYDYNYTFNGFAAEMTPGQVDALMSVSGVLNVTKDEVQSITTSSTPTFLGLDAPGGLWD